MPKRVPQYLKEIPTALSGQTEGDYASEWDFAHNPYQHENYGRGEQEWSANYLGWWNRGRRGVYYFGEHQRPAYFKKPDSYYWDAYDWYKNTAAKINTAFENEEKAWKAMSENPNLFSEKDLTADTPELKLYYSPNLEKPDYIRNINGIYAWLYNKYAPTKKFLDDYNTKASNYNKAIRALWQKRYEQNEAEKENIKKAAEDAKYNNITTQLTALRHEIVKVSKDVKQLSKDKDEEFSLFKSELTSKIPDVSLNVSRFEHDEDIAQLNETLQGIRGSINKNAKLTGDSIAMLQRKVNMSMNDISRTNNSIMDISKRVNENEKKNRLLLDEEGKVISSLKITFDKAQEEVLAQSNEIDNLRKNLLALGGETREFIDNTKRQEQAMKAKVAKRESVVTRIVKKSAFPDLTKRPWLKESVTGRFFQLANQW